jgi:hypothetical protein
MEPVLRKPRSRFETAQNPSHITFDDGHQVRRNLPWLHYVEARWAYGEPETIQVLIGEWLVILRGHNLGALFAALEEHTLFRVKAQPESQDRERECDSYVFKIIFVKAEELSLPPQGELDFTKPA